MESSRRNRTWTTVAFSVMGGSSILLGAIEFGIAVTHVRGPSRNVEGFAVLTGLALVGLGIGFVRRAIRMWVRQPRAE